ncbi:carbohydrate-binding module family 43 protein [Postia placenta MAD-698-R-SB12]|uniref:1,3-beta-glucanosyltransferase n=1 Tax=Postia placenta MAD-698-R-SB12 TaxID=670580 RepID=A0A1X6NH40_9APHY|nr:carbohydrate-binding module family 43 protein [Postia placenta MAD-698-R-SB12]OSX67830.1 carbohydrate-binding module family 43 protein [Postia placenta MAD-698-R-SB12]
MSGYGVGLEAALGDPIGGLYTSNASAPLQQQAGVRQIYDFGLYSYCGYVNATAGRCSNISAANRFEPLQIITADMLTNYSAYTDSIFTSPNTFTDSKYLGDFSNGAYYPLLIGTVCAALALFVFMLLIGAAIWTVIIKKAETINDLMVGKASSPTPLGIVVSMGNGVYLAWAAFACLIASVLPYMIRINCFTRPAPKKKEGEKGKTTSPPRGSNSQPSDAPAYGLVVLTLSSPEPELNLVALGDPKLYPDPLAATVIVALFSSAHCAVQKVSRNGRYLYTADGNRFYIKGVAYQEQGAVIATANNPFLEPSTFIDPLANSTSCERDLPYLKQLNVNAVRIYSVNSSLNHDDCMNNLSSAGIYTIEWCGDADPSVYDGTNGDFAGYNIPAYFSEYGCVTSPPRLWTEVQALLSAPMTEIWSGGVAFSYFPASSAAGQFGMVTINPNNTVTVSSDFTRLQEQYANVTPPDAPSQSSAGSTAYPGCPSENSTFSASTTLPPTPNDAACSCLENALSCQFTPTTSNTSAIVGTLINTACSLLGAQGGNCDDIAGNGTTGVYGRASACDPSVQLSFVMSEYYEATNRNAQSCDFSGNATINSQAPSSVSAAAVATSCVSNPSATFTPSAPATASGAAGSGTSHGNASGSAHMLNSPRALLRFGVVVIISIAGGLLTVM